MKLLPKFPCSYADIDQKSNIVVIGVESEVVKTLQYIASTESLVVQFQNDTMYHYMGVSLGTVIAMLESDSAGKFLNAEIKPNYEVSKW